MNKHTDFHTADQSKHVVHTLINQTEPFLNIALVLCYENRNWSEHKQAENIKTCSVKVCVCVITCVNNSVEKRTT